MQYISIVDISIKSTIIISLVTDCDILTRQMFCSYLKGIYPERTVWLDITQDYLLYVHTMLNCNAFSRLICFFRTGGIPKGTKSYTWNKVPGTQCTCHFIYTRLRMCWSRSRVISTVQNFLGRKAREKSHCFWLCPNKQTHGNFPLLVSGLKWKAKRALYLMYGMSRVQKHS